MATSSMIRRVDSLGRIVIPMELRRKLNIGENDTVIVIHNKNMVYIKKANPSCIFCGSSMAIEPFKGRHVCSDCRYEIKCIRA